MCAKNRANLIAIIITASIVAAVTLYLYPLLYLPRLFASRYLVYGDKPKVLVLWRQGLGERELGERILKIAPKLGINVRFLKVPYMDAANIFERYALDCRLLASQAMQPDMILVIDRAVPPIAGFRNYVVMDQRMETYIKQKDGKNVFIQPCHYEFTGMFPTFKEIDILQRVVEDAGKKFRGFNWRPTVHRNNYLPQAPKRLFFPGGALNDDTRSTQKYKQVLTLLAQQGYLEVYGWKQSLSFLKTAYRGFIPIDGESLIKINNDAGISLLLHAHEHLHSGTPTGRIFESAAANTVMISDKHAFVMEHFGDNVLYIDVDVDATEMFRQIDQHMQWIYAHPAEAKQMAQRCHDIFMEKFTLEDLLQRVITVGLAP